MSEPADADRVHCCACALGEDKREISVTVLSVAQAIVTDSAVGTEVRDAAESLLTAAFKAEKRKHDALGLPSLG